MNVPKIKNRINVWGYLALGYLAVIAVGTALLLLPFSAKSGKTPFIDAFFTAVSAACVTGLVPFETNAHWTGFGQAVILLLIQFGGLGFMTFVSILLMLVKRLGQFERKAVMQSVGGTFSGVKALVRRILIGTVFFETVGAAVLCIPFVRDFGWGTGVWRAVFHSVSAFCNAGFDIMGNASMSAYVKDPLVTLTLCVLISVGGLGFCIWGDVWESRFNPKKMQFYTKVILAVNSFLIVSGTLLFLLFERNSAAYAGLNFWERLLASLFNSVTARTAGFYTTDPALLSDSGSILMIILMFIGGSSGSTAGGLKVGTFTVIILGMVAVFRSKRDLTLGRRRIDNRLLFQALAIFAAYLILIVTATCLICALEPDGTNTTLNAVFETVSALGTVGLTRAYTETLGWGSKLVLIALMYAGRAGVLTLAFALGRKKSEAAVRRPVDTFFIG